jgi:polyhydroxyalkanoate synthesis regulator phasin
MAGHHRLGPTVAKKKDKDKGKAGRADVVRSAVNDAFATTQQQSAAAAEQGREAAQDIVDQLAQAAGRVRDVIEELRPPTGDDVKELRRRLDALEQRVAALETKPKPAAKRATTTRRSSSGQSKS